MGYFDKKIKKAKENEFKLNNKMHTKLIEKANCKNTLLNSSQPHNWLWFI